MADKFGVGMTRLQYLACALEEAAAFGRWRYHHALDRVEVSPVAARCLDIKAGAWQAPEDSLRNVVADDLNPLMALKSATRATSCEFRVVTAKAELR